MTCVKCSLNIFNLWFKRTLRISFMVGPYFRDVRPNSTPWKHHDCFIVRGVYANHCLVLFLSAREHKLFK
ncbi:hypothetical protein OESDEN_22772 [Oesophagostomum dentatum]|uniref:Uncharacterized protein n=1 Tax=Oesophagostomum dentatum TaxID=61180 RepID=A0A0B1RWZ6_OESDE|nr:hypothetical protein OESDEN_22772 [Oesophagostomum dentatum]